MTDVEHGVSLGVHTYASMLESKALHRSDAKYSRLERYATANNFNFTDLFDNSTYRYFSDSEKHVLIENGKTSFALISAWGGPYVTIRAHGESQDAVNALIESIKEKITPAPAPNKDQVKVAFWYQTNNGPVSVSRNIDAPKWEEVQENYSRSTQDSVEKLMIDFPPTNGGKIILFHGPPGTGKTYALRALVREWKNIINACYILDPETLFGGSPGYLTQMIFSNLRDEEDEDDEFLMEVPQSDKNKWNLLILEDTGELLALNARENAGQGFSRLLNLADGFIGQGLKTLILITTNEELHKLNPAVTREGRCAASLRFGELPDEEAHAWAGRNGFKLPVGNMSKHWILADLYAAKSGNTKVENKVVEKAFGFRPS